MVPGIDPDDSVYGMLHSSQIKDGRNYAAFRDGSIDALLEEGRARVDPASRTECYRRIARRLDELQPYTYLFSPMTQAALARRIGDIRPGPRGLLVQYPGVARLHDRGRPGG